MVGGWPIRAKTRSPNAVKVYRARPAAPRVVIGVPIRSGVFQATSTGVEVDPPLLVPRADC